MITADTVISLMQEASSCHTTPNGFAVSTHCMYPSNDVVQIEVTGHKYYTVSDRGNAVDVLVNHGVPITDPSRSLAQFAVPQGLSVGNSGAIFANEISLEALPLFIVLVANASKDAASVLLEKHRFNTFAKFRDELAFQIKATFGDKATPNKKVSGASNKVHVFDHSIVTRSKKFLLIDTAIDDGNSINSVVVSNLDVRLKNDPTYIQRIVYDDREDWRAESLLLLEEGAPTVAFSHVIPELEKTTEAAVF